MELSFRETSSTFVESGLLRLRICNAMTFWYWRFRIIKKREDFISDFRGAFMCLSNCDCFHLFGFNLATIPKELTILPPIRGSKTDTSKVFWVLTAPVLVAKYKLLKNLWRKLYTLKTKKWKDTCSLSSFSRAIGFVVIVIWPFCRCHRRLLLWRRYCFFSDRLA